MNKVSVNGGQMHFYSNPEPIPQGQVKFSTIEFVFDSAWDNRTKTVQFIQDTKVINALVENDVCIVPHNLNLGYIEFAVRGDGVDGSIGTANRLQLEIVPSFSSGGEPEIPPGPDLYNQLLSRIDEAEGIAQSVRDDANNGVFKGDKGDSPYIGTNGNWWVGTTDTQVKARGPQGNPGITPHIGENNNWFIGTVDTNILAKGQNGVTPNVQAGSTTMTDPGTDASVSRRAGSPDSAPIFDFSIPRNHTIDAAMSDTSENAVQNKVIKAYVDGLVGDVESALSAI